MLRYQFSLLVEAIREGDIKGIRKYFEIPLGDYNVSGVVNSKTLTDNTPLILATDEEDFEVVKFLLDNGADPNLTGRQCLTILSPLHVAVRSQNFRIINLLIKRGADINAKDSYGETPIFRLVRPAFEKEKCNPKLLKYLIEKGADMNIKNLKGQDFYDSLVLDDELSILGAS